MRPTEDCFQELPVYWVIFLIGERWFKMLPQITMQETPSILQLQTQQTWNYNNPTDLANSGIYSYGDIESLKSFPTRETRF